MSEEDKRLLETALRTIRIMRRALEFITASEEELTKLLQRAEKQLAEDRRL